MDLKLPGNGAGWPSDFCWPLGSCTTGPQACSQWSRPPPSQVFPELEYHYIKLLHLEADCKRPAPSICSLLDGLYPACCCPLRIQLSQQMVAFKSTPLGPISLLVLSLE